MKLLKPPACISNAELKDQKGIMKFTKVLTDRGLCAELKGIFLRRKLMQSANHVTSPADCLHLSLPRAEGPVVTVFSVDIK